METSVVTTSTPSQIESHEHHTAVIDPELVAKLSQGNGILDSYATTQAPRAFTMARASSPALIFTQCQAILQKAEELLGGPKNNMYKTDVLDALGECYTLAAALPQDFRVQIYQRVADIVCSFIESTYSKLEACLSDSTSVREYLEYNNDYQRALQFYDENLAPLSSQSLDFAARDVAKDFEDIFSLQCAKLDNSHSNHNNNYNAKGSTYIGHWNDLVIFGASYANVPVDRIKTLYHTQREERLLANLELSVKMIKNEMNENHLEYLMQEAHFFEVALPSKMYDKLAAKGIVVNANAATISDSVVKTPSTTKEPQQLPVTQMDDILTTTNNEKVQFASDVKLPQDWDEILSLAQTYVDTLWSYPHAAEAGYNLVYGPLCDTASSEGSYMKMQGRITAQDPETAALLARLTMAATQKSTPHMGFVLKHAPGIGSVTENPEYGNLQIDNRSADKIAHDLSAFERALSLQGNAVMVSGVAYPQLEENNIIRPATLSPDVCLLLRQRFGEDTVLFSDDLTTTVFQIYYAGLDGKSVVEFNELSKYATRAIIDATNAGIDVCLTYAHSADLSSMLEPLVQVTESGEISRETLEASVLRILRYKKTLFPDAPALASPEVLIKEMSVEELWAQKIIYPSYSLYDSDRFLRTGVGGLTFEGIRKPGVYIELAERMAAEHPERIPPFLANNSPQELNDSHSSAHPFRQRERDIMRELAQRLEADYPKGVPAEIADLVFAEIITTPQVVPTQELQQPSFQ